MSSSESTKLSEYFIGYLKSPLSEFNLPFIIASAPAHPYLTVIQILTKVKIFLNKPSINKLPNSVDKDKLSQIYLHLFGATEIATHLKEILKENRQNYNLKEIIDFFPKIDYLTTNQVQNWFIKSLSKADQSYRKSRNQEDYENDLIEDFDPNALTDKGISLINYAALNRLNAFVDLLILAGGNPFIEELKANIVKTLKSKNDLLASNGTPLELRIQNLYYRMQENLKESPEFKESTDGLSLNEFFTNETLKEKFEDIEFEIEFSNDTYGESTLQKKLNEELLSDSETAYTRNRSYSWFVNGLMVQSIKTEQQKMESIEMDQEVQNREEVVQKISQNLQSCLNLDERLIFEDTLATFLDVTHGTVIKINQKFSDWLEETMIKRFEKSNDITSFAREVKYLKMAFGYSKLSPEYRAD